MTIRYLRERLSSRKKIGEEAFHLLHLISAYVNDADTEDVGRELVLRALDRREEFDGLQEVMDALTRQVGLFPYLDEDSLGFRDLLAYEFHRPVGVEESVVFHRAQAEVYRRLINGENVILSAPTSFGKSRIIDALLASEKYVNMAVVVPTIALIDETRKRLTAFRDKYKIITQVSQEVSDKNIFIFTAERVVAFEEFPKIDFFVIDEFYKIGALVEDESRTVALNQAFYKLHKAGGQFYMLGPNIQHIPPGLEDRFRCFFYSTHFATVASEIIPVFDWDNDIHRLVELASELDGQTLIYCRSPKRVNEVARALFAATTQQPDEYFDGLIDWASNNFHPDWVYQKALGSGVGIHHGKLPRSLGQYSVAAFNEEKIKFLVCTSTLIEGVNTKAKNVVIFDNIVGGKKFDFFTFNNIKGRSGRMFQHFVGRVFVFHQPPQEELPFVDFPLFTQDASTPDSLLIQLDEEDLKPASLERLSNVFRQDVLPIELIKANSGLDPASQVQLAEYLSSIGMDQAKSLLWTGIPSWEEVNAASVLVWDFLTSRRPRSGVFSGKQLAFKIYALMHEQNVRVRVEAELEPGQYQAKSADEAVERVLEFDRNWASFEIPRLFMALSKIQEYVFKERFGRAGDYSFFSARAEALFRNPVAVALEEYGLPMQITDKIAKIIPLSDEIDAAICEIKMLPPEGMGLLAFEEDLLRQAQQYL